MAGASIETALFLVLILVGAFVAFVLVDRAGQEPPIPMVIKLAILVIALFAMARLFGVA